VIVHTNVTINADKFRLSPYRLSGFSFKVLLSDLLANGGDEVSRRVKASEAQWPLSTTDRKRAMSSGLVR
jgi:hypothetical protein